MGKDHRLPSQHTFTIYKSPLELIYSALWGPAPIMSSNNLSYHIPFLDAYSRFTRNFF